MPVGRLLGLGGLGRVGDRGGRRRRGLGGLEELHRLEHRVHRVDGDGVLVVHRVLDPRDAVGGVRLDGHLVALVLHREVEVLGGAVGGEGVHDAVVGLEAPQRVVDRDGVEEQQRRLAVGGEVLVRGHERPHGVVGGAERRHAAVGGRLERGQRVGRGRHQRRERLAAALRHRRRDVRRGWRGRRGAFAFAGAAAALPSAAETARGKRTTRRSAAARRRWRIVPSVWDVSAWE